MVATATPPDYAAFLASKRITTEAAGFAVDEAAINPMLFPFQRRIVQWAIRRGKAALFEDCGLGKGPQQFEWARLVSAHEGRPVLIVAPLGVAIQAVEEAAKFGITLNLCRSQADVQPGINITNYDMLHHFTAEVFAGIVLDESSCLKSFSGSERKAITAFGAHIPYRLCCTATPAPNDLIELTNHAEFLDIMSGKEIIALFFTQDGNTTHKWRLKGHAADDFWRWMASWSVALRKPSDLGFSDEGYILPPLRLHQVTVAGKAAPGQLFAVEAQTLEERRIARKGSLTERVAAAAKLVNGNTETWVVWCDFNDESTALTKAIPGAVEVTGSDSPSHKERVIRDFLQGRIRVLVSKPSIFGFGINMQHCARMVFVGLSDSYEKLYQAIRRCWRFGQIRAVDAYIITSETEGAVVKNIKRKEKQAEAMMASIISHTAGLALDQAERSEMDYEERVASGRDWTLYLGDSVMLMDALEDNSVGLTVTSPPFPGMYAYTNSAHDIGNTTTVNEMVQHFRYLMGREKVWRVTMPGRMCCIHLMQLTAMKSREGYIGLHDYRGHVIQMMIEEGWVYAGEVTIDKNPQVQATRNKERGLLFKTLATDSSLMRMALADYLLYFRKPGDNPLPIHAGMSKKYNPQGGWITEEEWIEWAAPVWQRQSKAHPHGIRETDVLNVALARDTDDERHLCPLQLGVIERAIKLWSAPGDLVMDPFNGVGSVGYQALRFGRRYAGFELKRSYWQSSQTNLERAAREKAQPGLFDVLEEAA